MRSTHSTHLGRQQPTLCSEACAGCLGVCMRQIKLQELHKQIEELTSKVSSLQSENASLFSRTNILEKVLDMRNEQIQVMHETKEVRMPGQGRAAQRINSRAASMS